MDFADDAMRTEEHNHAVDRSTASISGADHAAAVTAAFADGGKAAIDRLTAVLGAVGVKGDAGRMTAALNLAVASPGMGADDIATFVVLHVAVGVLGGNSPESYSAARVAASVDGERRWTADRQEEARQRNMAAGDVDTSLNKTTPPSA